MPYQTNAQTIESFHLLFLQVLTARGHDSFVLKGGANLRYFFDSIRYSNDIDFDFVGRDSEALERAVDGVLNGKPLSLLLRRATVEVVSIAKSKQTATTRRWKVGLRRSDMRDGESIPTKIEFSSRPGSSDDVLVTRVPDVIVSPYGHMAPTLRHYGEIAAIEQKMWALADRSETKARDVFDLELLFRRRVASGLPVPGLSTEHSAKAADRATELSYESYRSEVVPFLDPDVAEIFGSEEAWEQIRGYVIDRLLEVTKGNEEGSTS